MSALSKLLLKKGSNSTGISNASSAAQAKRLLTYFDEQHTSPVLFRMPPAALQVLVVGGVEVGFTHGAVPQGLAAVLIAVWQQEDLLPGNLAWQPRPPQMLPHLLRQQMQQG
jgi:hypothetical protein